VLGQSIGGGVGGGAGALVSGDGSHRSRPGSDGRCEDAALGGERAVRWT
jgi:hypothetical protein